MADWLEDFVRESNRIEGILRDPLKSEIDATFDFLSLDVVTVKDVVELVSVYAPGHQLRNKHGLDVRVGNHIAPRGAPGIETSLDAILQKARSGR